MKTTKISIRIWLAMASVAGFLGGWALLAHSPKPAQPVQNPAQVEFTQLPTLAPIPSTRGRNRGLQKLPSFPQSSFSFPRMRTGGS